MKTFGERFYDPGIDNIKSTSFLEDSKPEYR